MEGCFCFTDTLYIKTHICNDFMDTVYLKSYSKPLNCYYGRALGSLLHKKLENLNRFGVIFL